MPSSHPDGSQIVGRNPVIYETTNDYTCSECGFTDKFQYIEDEGESSCCRCGHIRCVDCAIDVVRYGGENRFVKSIRDDPATTQTVPEDNTSLLQKRLEGTPPIVHSNDRTDVSSDTVKEGPAPTQTEGEFRRWRQNELDEWQATVREIRNQLNQIGNKTETYFPVGSFDDIFDEIWLCEFRNAAEACPWTGKFRELVSHFATSHHIFQDAGPNAEWTVCLHCNTPTPGWGPPTKCRTKACSTYGSWQRWYWGSLVKPVGTQGGYDDAVKGKTHKATTSLTGSHSQHISEHVNSQPGTWTTGSSPYGAYPSSASGFTKSTDKSDATPHTSIPSGSSYSHLQKIQGRDLPGIQEEEAQMVMDTPVHGTSTEELLDLTDTFSVISQGSTEYSPHQKDDAILRFTQAMLKRLPKNLNYVGVDETSRRHLLHHLRLTLKNFAVVVEAASDNNAHRRGIRMVRRLRQEIASKVHDEILSLSQATESSRDVILFTEQLPPITIQERVSDWTANIDLPVNMNNQDPHTYQDLAEATPRFRFSPSPTNSSVTIDLGAQEIISSLQARLAHSTLLNPYGSSVDLAEVMDNFTKHSAFDSLIDETERLFQRYHGQKMNLIRQCTSLALRRHAGDSRNLSAFFSVSWSPAEFLVNNYDDGVGQKLERILATTGGSETAIMCTVAEYMTWYWPEYSTQLLHLIETVLRSSGSEQTWYCTYMPGVTGGKEPDGDQRANNPPFEVPTPQYIMVDSTLRRFEVKGAEDFIISIAQQLSWLAAVCQEKSKTRSHAYVGFSQAADLSIVGFEIDVTLEAPSDLESGSCWNKIVGPAVVINGFPIPERAPEDRGLEVSVSVMASLAGLSQAVTFGGGFVFKGRYHALVPIRESSESVQWHVIDTYPKRLRWTDIDKRCPDRLHGEADGEFFWQKRSFLGWCPRVIELLGTANFDYESVQHSKAYTYGRRPQLDKVTAGFSQWAQLTAEFSLGKKDGFRRANELDDYEMLLNDAESMHVILYDTTHRRAYQTNVEELILHIIHHREKMNLPRKTNDLEFVDADRRVKTTRQVMHNNSEKVLHMRPQVSSSTLKEHRFKEEVKLLYSILDGLWANIYECEGTSLKLGLPFKQTASIFGWEYMDVVKNCRRMSPKTTELRKTCGRWNMYAKDIQALVLFGANFGDILKPASAGSICSTFSSLPRNECYLAVRADVIEDLFDQQGSLEDQAKLTPSGYTLNGPKTLYGRCNDNKHRKAGLCTSSRVLQIVKRSIHKNVPIPLEVDGAVIIGETKLSFRNILRREQQEEKQTSTKPQHQQTQPSSRASQGSSTTANILDSTDHRLSQKVGVTKAVVHPEDLLSVKSSCTTSASNGQWSGSSVNPTSNTTSISSDRSSSGPSTRDVVVSSSSSNHYRRIPADIKGKQPVKVVS